MDPILFGWLSSLFLALCGVPQAWKCFREGHADGISWGFIYLWTLGEICGLIYVMSIWSWPLIANYGFNVLITLIILKFKIRRTDES